MNVGAMDTKSLTVMNTSFSGSLTVTSASLPSGFYLQTSLPLTIGPNQSSSLVLGMYTSASGSFSGPLTIQDSDSSNSPFTLNLSGAVSGSSAPSMTLRDGSTTLTNGASDSFGSVTTGSQANKQFSVSNSGTSTLTVSSVSLPTGFSLGTSLPLNVPAGQSATFTVSMNTSAPASPSGLMTIQDNDTHNSPFYVNLSGTVTAASPATLELFDGSTQLAANGSDSLGTVTVGAADQKTFTVKNIGGATLTVGSVSLPSGFNLGTSLPMSIAANSSASLVVNLVTSSAASYSGSMSISSNDTSSPLAITISGEVDPPPAPIIGLSEGGTSLPASSSDDFGTVDVGASDSQTFTISNTGTAALNVSAITLPSGFSYVTPPSLPLAIAAGQSATFGVSLNTTAAGSPAGILAISSDDRQHSPYNVYLSGTVVPPPRVLAVTDGATSIAINGSDDFGATLAGTPVNKTFTITNSSSSPIAINSNSLVLPNGFNLQGTFPSSVPASGSVTFIVQLAANSPGNDSGLLSFTDADAGGGSYQFNISGAVTAPSIAVMDQSTWLPAGTTDNFGQTTVGTPLDKRLTIQNNGSGLLTLSPTSLSLPAGFSLVGNFPSSVGADGTASFVVQLDAKVAGSATGELSFNDSDPQNSPFSIVLAAAVAAPVGAIVVLDGQTPIIDGGSQIAFASTNVGVSETRSFAIENQGPAALSLDATTLSIPAGYSVPMPFVASVAPGESTTLTIELIAAAGGDFDGQVSFDTDDPRHPTFSFLVSGHVNSPTPAISVFDGATEIASGSGNDSFGATPLGTLAKKTFTITDNGSAPLELDTRSLSLPVGYSLVTPFTANVAPGQSTSLTVALSAASAGAYSGAISFTDNSTVPGASPFQINVTGQVLAPAMAVTLDGQPLANNSGSIDFGSTPLGSPVTRTLTISNGGTSDLLLDTASLGLPVGFSVVSSFAGDVAPGGSTTLTVEMNATAAGVSAGSMHFTDNDPATDLFMVALTGSVTVGGIAVFDGATAIANASGSDDFGTTPAGTPIEKTYTIDNTGAAPLSLDATSLALPQGYSLVSAFAPTVAPGASTTLVVRLDAQTVGSYPGTIAFSDGDPANSTFSWQVSGQVTAPALEVRYAGTTVANGSSLSVGTTTVGTPLLVTLAITNDGSQAVSLDAASLALPSGFALVQPFAGALAAGAATSLVVQLDATAVGTAAGTLSFETNDPAADPYSIPISGQVTAPSIAVSEGGATIVSGATDAFGNTAVDTPIQQAFKIDNVGSSVLSIDVGALAVPARFSLVTAPAASVQVGGETTMVVQLDAATAGSYTGTLVVPSDDPLNAQFTITLTGEALASTPTVEVFQGGEQVANGAALPAITTLVGAGVDETLTIDNVSSQALSIGSATLPAGYSLVTAPAASVPAGGSTTLVARLDATTAGDYGGALSFATGDAGNPTFSVTLAATVTQPAPAIALLDGTAPLADGSGTLAFPATVVGSPLTKTIEIENTGAATLTLDTGSLTAPSGFSITSLPAASIAPGGSTTMTIELNAAAAADWSGTLSLGNNTAADNPFTIALTGEVVAPAAGVAVYAAGSSVPNGVGSDSLGSTSLGHAITQAIVIENTGTATLSLDPASITLPAGFSVATPFDSTVAGGGTTTLLVRLDAATAGTFNGTISFGYNSGQADTFAFTISGTVTAAEPQDVTIDGFGLANDLGPSDDARTTDDPRVTGTVDGELNGGSVIVQFDTNGDGIADASLPAITTAGTAFTFDPRTVDAALAGYVGAADLHYRALVDDAADNLVSTTPWTDFAFTMVAPPTSAHVDDFGLVNDTGASNTDTVTYDPRVTGTIGGPFLGASVDVEFDENGSGTPIGSVTDLTTPGDPFTFNPVDDDPSLANFAGSLTLDYRTVERDAQGNVLATGAWTPFAMTLYTPAPSASVSGFQLVNDDGVSSTDRITSDPTVTGTVNGTFTGETVEVQFSDSGDGTVNGFVGVSQTGQSFTYDPRLADPALNGFAGAVNLAYRTVEYDALGGAIAGPWVNYPITLTVPASTVTIDNLRLTDITGAAGPPPVTDDPTVAGSVVASQAPSVSQVQFQYNGDGQTDATATLAADGTFSITLARLPYGVVTVDARAVVWDNVGQEFVYGPWSSLTFDYEPPPVPTIASLALANTTDTATGGTTDPTLTGELSGGWSAGTLPGGSEAASAPLLTAQVPTMTVEFDTNGDGQPDAETEVAPDGSFRLTPTNLAFGTVTVAARVADHDPNRPALADSAWTSITFIYEAPPALAPIVNDLRLAHDTGASATDNITSDPTITGRVSFPNPAGSGTGSSGTAISAGPPTTADLPPLSTDPSFLTVEIDTNGDGTPDATTTTGPGGTFSYKPTGLSYGTVTVQARAVGRDALQNKIYGNWVALTFTYQQAAATPATLASLKLADPLPANGVADLTTQTTSDPTIVGQVAKPGDTSPTAVAGLTVQLDTNGDGTPDASAITDADGNFSFRPTGLANGSVTIAARVRTHDYATAGFDYSAWTTLTFTYQAASSTAPSMTSLVLADDSGSGDSGDGASDGVTANPTVKGTLDLPSAALGSTAASQPVLIQLDTNGDGVPDGVAWADGQGNFIYTPQNMAYGPVTIAARAATWDSTSGAYVAGAWKSLSFTYEQEAKTAPNIVSLGLQAADGTLDTTVTAATVFSSPIVAGQVSYQGDLAGITIEFDTTGDRTPDATATTDQYGDFSYVPAGLTAGIVTIETRTRVFDGDANVWLVGNWTPLSFTYQAPAAGAPTVSSLALANDDGVSNTDNVTSDPTVTGTAAGATSGTGAALVIQFDTNGDGTPDATTTADGQGDFTWTPTALAAGQVTIAARAVDRDSAGTAVTGAWTSLTFTLTAAAAPTTVASLTLADNVGPSASAPISTDGIVVGQLSGPSVANVPVQIDNNGDGTPEAVVTSDSGGNFSYTLPAPAEDVVNLAARVAPSADASTGDGSTGSDTTSSGGGWTSYSFVSTADPGSSQAQSEAQAISAASTANQSATTGHQQTLTTDQGNYQTDLTSAATSLEAALAQAQATRESANGSAQSAYNTTSNQAGATYNQSMATAAGSFAQDLTNDQGDKTSFTDPGKFAWPDGPQAPPGPDDSANRPTLPADAPTFSGPAFDPTQDPGYQSALSNDQAGYDVAVTQAGDNYASAVSLALSVKQGLTATAQQALEDSFARADADYNTALATPNPTSMVAAHALSAMTADDWLAALVEIPVFEANEQFKYDFFTYEEPVLGLITAALNAATARSQEDQQAQDDYGAAVKADQADFEQKMSVNQGQQQTDAAYVNALNLQIAAAEDRHGNLPALELQLASAEAQLAADRAEALGLQAALGQDLADDQKAEKKALAEADREYADKVVEAQGAIVMANADDERDRLKRIAEAVDKAQKFVDYLQATAPAEMVEAANWATENQAAADDARTIARSVAEQAFTNAQADAELGYQDALSAAARDQQKTLADAQQALDFNNAQAVAQAAATWAQVEGTPWATYQAALAQDEATYVHDSGVQQDQFAHTEADDAYNAAHLSHLANQTQAYALDLDQRQDAGGQADALKAYLVGRAECDSARAAADAAAWQKDLDGSADADLIYANQEADAQLTRTEYDEGNIIGHTENQAEAAYELASGVDPNQVAAEINGWTVDYNNTFVRNRTTEFDSTAAAAYERGRTKLENYDGYQGTYADDEATWADDTETVSQTDETGLASIESLRQAADAQAQADDAKGAANAQAGQAIADAGAESGDWLTEAGIAETADLADATALETFEESTADAYASTLSSWASSLNSPWASEQARMATADAAWVHAVAPAQYNNVKSIDDAQIGWITTASAAAVGQVTDDSNAWAAAVGQTAQAAADHVKADGIAWLTEVNQVAEATTVYDTAAVDDARQEVKHQADQTCGYRVTIDNELTLEEVAVESDEYLNSTDQESLADETAHIKQAILKQAQDDAAAGITWSSQAAGDLVTEVSDTDTAKVAWIGTSAAAQAQYLGTTATNAATEITTDANAWAGLAGTLASDQSTLDMALAGADTVQATGDATADESLSHTENTADASDEVAYAQAGATYLDTLWNQYAQAESAAVSNPALSPVEQILVAFDAAVAAAESQQVQSDETAEVELVTKVTQANVAADDADFAAAEGVATGAVSAAQTEADTADPKIAAAVATSAQDQAKAIGDDATARAQYVSAAALAAAGFASVKAGANAGYDNAVAQAGAAMAATETTAWVDLNIYDAGGPAGPNVSAAIDQATATWESALHDAGVARASTIGDGEIAQATQVGQAEVTLAGTEGGIETTLVTGLTGQADSLAGTLATADEAFVSTVANSAAGLAKTLAGDDQTYAAGVDPALVAYQQALGTDEVTSAGGIAGAEANYAVLMAQQSESAAIGYASANHSPDATFQVDYDEQLVDWLSSLEPTFVADSKKLAQDDADYQNAQAAEGQHDDTLSAAAEVAFAQADAPAAAGEAASLNSAQDDYGTSVIQHLDGEANTLATADGVRMTGMAIADAAWLVAAAGADKDEQVRTAQLYASADPTAAPLPVPLYNSDMAAARLAWVTGRDNANTGWTTSQAGADQEFAIQDAGSWQSLITTSAGAADTFAHADDAAVAASNDAAAQITADDMNAQAAADQAQATADAAAEGDFSDAEANQTSTEWQSIVQDLNGASGTPWAQAEADKAAAEATWQSTATSDEEQYVSTVSGDEVTYASDNAAKFLTEARALDAADQTAADGAADATQGLAGTLASDEVTFELTAASATDGFQIGMANGQSAYDIAMATASLDLANGGTTADYTAAVATAAAGLTTANASAASVYRGLIGPADALQTTDDANAVFLAVKTTADALLLDATDADSAIDVYSNAESVDYDQQTKDDAQALETLQVDDADGEASAIHSEAGAAPSPWLNEMAAQALAAAAQIDTLAPAQQTLTDDLADALAAYEEASADADQTDADALAKAWHDQTIADAQADQSQAITSANATTSLSSGGAYVTALPDSIFAAFGTSGDPATLSADFGFTADVNDVSLDGAGWSYSVASTSEDFTGLAGTAAAMSPDLVDNPPYAPPNPYANLYQLHLHGDPPDTGGSGSGGTQQISAYADPTPPAVPETNPEGAEETGKQLEGSNARPGADAANQEGPGDADLDPPTDGGANKRFSDGKGPVSIIGIVGRYENTTARTGIKIIVEAAAIAIQEEEATEYTQDEIDRYHPDLVTGPEKTIYTSSPQAETHDKEPEESAADIAEAEMVKIRARLAGRISVSPYRVVIIGFSYGGDKAIEVVNKLNEKIAAEHLSGSVEIHLRTIDAVDRESGDATATGPTRAVELRPGIIPELHLKVQFVSPVPAVASWYNWFQTLQELGGGEMESAGAKDIPSDEAVEGANPIDEFGKPTGLHRALVMNIKQQVVDSLLNPKPSEDPVLKDRQ